MLCFLCVSACMLLPSDVQAAEAAEQQTETEAAITVQKSIVKSTKLVASKKLRINWSRSKGATGYELYRRAKGSSAWKKIETVTGEKQTYCYDGSVAAKKTYYYQVKPYVKADGKKVYASGEAKSLKVSYKSVTVNPKAGNYRKGSVYGPYLSAKKLSQVKKAVKSFHRKYVTSDMTPVEKVLTAQLFMARYCAYAPDYRKNEANSAWGALVYKNSDGLHEAQCSGFSRGFKALCDSMGVPCRYVHANSKSANPNHQWNEVKIDGKWYIVDPQCNASSGFLAFFLCSKNTYKNYSGMRWNEKNYPAVSSKDYPAEKIENAANGYKITKVYNKLFR